MQIVKDLMTLPGRVQPVKHLLLRHQRRHGSATKERFEQILKRKLQEEGQCDCDGQ